MKENKKRYESVSYKGVRGIRKDLSSNSFYVEKYIRGERYNQTFSNIKDAADWKKNFHPSLSLKRMTDSKVKESARKKVLEIEAKKSVNAVKIINGNDLKYIFSDIWELYIERHLSKIEESSKAKKIQDACFYDELMDIPMIDFNAELISSHIELKKRFLLKTQNQDALTLIMI
jgi:hypothetical protein